MRGTMPKASCHDSLAIALPVEMRRVARIAANYESRGMRALIAHHYMQHDLEMARNAIAACDLAAMLKALTLLKGWYG